MLKGQKDISSNYLIREQGYTGAGWVPSLTRQTFEVINPSTRQVLVKVSDFDERDAELAVSHATKAFLEWKRTSPSVRASLLKKWFDLIIAEEISLASLLTAEQGKPMAEARAEIRYGASFIEWFSEEARRTYGTIIPSHQEETRLFAIKQPVGIVAAITPWNFPNAMITRKAGAALAAGCVFMVKPAEETPLSALALAALAEQAGIPKGVFQVLPSSKPKLIGEVFTSHPAIQKLSFTGSTPVGKLLLKQSADTVKRVSLELGGNAPFIVFEDADLEKAVQGALAAKYRNAGQTCISVNRFYVHDSLYHAFVERLVDASSRLRVGDGFDEGVDVGPLINEAGLAKVEVLIGDAIAKGGEVACGGSRLLPSQLFFEPTVITHVKANMRLVKEEIFGPVVPVMAFSTEEEVIQLANDTSFGLASYFYGKDSATIWRVAEALEYGMVGVNTGLISTAVAPFGGVKESGFGREGSLWGMDEYLEIKYVALAD